jgi:two-component system, NarL family, nitrate/nitrite response regulator NarL
MATSTSLPIRVLVVDDHEVMRAGLRMLIESHPGLAVAGEAGTRAGLLAAAGRDHPDVIVLDLDLGGDQVVDCIPELVTTAAGARVLVLTGVRDPELHRRAVQLGAMGVVRKEKAAVILLDAIQKVHAGEAWLEPGLVAGVLSDLRRSHTAASADPEQRRIATLTKREREVIVLAGQGLKTKQLAQRLSISEITVRHHLTSIFDKLGVADRLELMIFAYRHGLAKPPR